MKKILKKIPLHGWILAALVLGIVAGSLTGRSPARFSQAALEFYTLCGTLFLRALKMLIVPLIASSIITGVSGVGSGQALERLGGKTLFYYLTTTLLAVLAGLALVNLLTPGIVDGQPAGERIGLDESAAAVAERLSGQGASPLWEFLVRMVPANIVAAAAEGQMLGLIFFCLLFGYFMTRLEGRAAEVLSGFWQGVFSVMMRITAWVMWFAPVGVFGLVAKVAATTGLEAVRPLALFMLTVLAGLALHFGVVLPLLLRTLGRTNPLLHYRTMMPALLTAFSTASSSGTLPVTMSALEKGAGVSNRTASFVTPLGATVNMDGTALYECVAALFIAQAYGLDLGAAAQFMVVALALLTSIGVAGVPAASLVAIVIILEAVGLPAEGVGLILAVDRLLDMCRTAVNVFSDSCGAVIIARSEGENPYGASPLP